MLQDSIQRSVRIKLMMLHVVIGQRRMMSLGVRYLKPASGEERTLKGTFVSEAWPGRPDLHSFTLHVTQAGHVHHPFSFQAVEQRR